ncbi:MAG: serine protease [Rhodospirillales bacterium]|nr:serine protease [Rhodospirillales bacterium]MBO6785450.1 serine protease [Rhodospirillales bacterium]
MANELIPDIDPALQPTPEDLSFDLKEALRAVYLIRTRVPEDGFTAQSLGSERAGHAVLIDERGILLTIGYLVVEAESVWLVDADGAAVEGHVLGADTETGFGLVQMLGRPSIKPLAIGTAEDLEVGDRAIVAGYGGCGQSVDVEVVGRREFAGYWEYLLDNAIFTSPPHPFWGGAALIGNDGTLKGIGSLFVQEGAHDGDDDEGREGNMIVPIDLLHDIKDDLLLHGQRMTPPRPWLGMFSAESAGKVVVAGLWSGGPADQAGLEAGDLVLEIGDKPVTSMASMYKTIWALGSAGVTVPLTIFRDKRIIEIEIESASRIDFYKKPGLH